jgi:uncharacterized protein (TIGR03435 family)
MLGLVLCATLAIVAAGTVRAQNDQPLTFDVASVRLTPPQTRVSHRITDTRVDLIAITLRQLLWMAFNIDPLCCRGHLSEPGWTGSVVVNVQASIPAGVSRQRVPEMMKALLIQRFGLRTHVEPRPTDGYELVVGDGGIKMKAVEPANEIDKVFPADPSVRSPRELSEEMLDGRRRLITIPFGNRIVTETSTYERRFTARGTQQIDAARMTMAELRSVLVMSTARPVIDGTKLTGAYTFSIELPVEAFASVGAAVRGADGTPREPTGVSAPKAVEQLGLELVPRRFPMDTIVVDHIERVPTEN